MSTPSPQSTPPTSVSAAVHALGWPDATREIAFDQWLKLLANSHGLVPDSVGIASADASFRRYFRARMGSGSCILMDAPPDKENNPAFVQIAQLFGQAGLRVPQVLQWDEAHGFMLLDDLGTHTMMQVLETADQTMRHSLFGQATDALLLLQQASRPDILPLYDKSLLQRELMLFPQWYVAQHKQVILDDEQLNRLHTVFDLVIAHNLAAPQVFVHRDFMPRNLMVSSSSQASSVLGVLDFQDAVYGPVTYDIASLMRDAFVSWDEDVCLDVTVRYWEKARRQGLLDFEDWHQDFGAFYRAVEWMGLQRHLKVAGIFARLGIRDNKPKYLADTPRFIAYLRSTASRYRELFPLLRLIDQIEDTSSAVAFSFGRL
jgi:aminoglycoside/choline kinase family phosphotransferase